MELFVSQLLNGLVYGLLLFLLASGLTLIFGLMGVVNLAHGSFFMLGAFIGLSVSRATGSFWWALVLAPIPVAIVAAAVEVVFLRHLYKRERIDQVLLTFGLSFVFTDLVEWGWSKDTFSLPEPASLENSVEFLGGFFPQYRLALVVFGLAVALLLWLLIEKTRIGAMVRAGIDDARTAMGIGLNVPLLLTATFASGAALAGMAGVVAGPVLGVYSGVDVEVLIPAFIVIVIGGHGQLERRVRRQSSHRRRRHVRQGLYARNLHVPDLRHDDRRVAGAPHRTFRTGRAAMNGLRVDPSPPRGCRGENLPWARLRSFCSRWRGRVVAGPYGTGLIAETLIFAIAAMSLDLLMGYSGLVSFGHAAFFGVGAYALALSGVKLGLDPWLGIPVAVATSALARALHRLFLRAHERRRPSSC